MPSEYKQKVCHEKVCDLKENLVLELCFRAFSLYKLNSYYSLKGLIFFEVEIESVIIILAIRMNVDLNNNYSRLFL